MGILPDCVVPAAGASSRMGEWKPLLPWGKGRVIDAVLACIEAAGLRPIVVAGYRGEELKLHLEGRPGLLIVDNPRWEEGMLGSVRRGAMETRGEAFFVLPADMPGLPPEVFASLLAARVEGRDEALFPAYRGEAGHPVLIPRSLLPEMRLLDPGGKLRDFLRRGSWRLVETGEAGVLADLDTREDYERGLRKLTPEVRRIAHGEAALYRRLRLAALRDAPEAFSTGLETAMSRDEESWTGQAEASTEGADRATFIAFSDGEAAGLVSLYRSEENRDAGELLQLWVAPERRGGGLAGALVDAALDWAGEAGIEEVIARVTEGNETALRFYRGRGFRELEAEGRAGGGWELVISPRLRGEAGPARRNAEGSVE